MKMCDYINIREFRNRAQMGERKENVLFLIIKRTDSLPVRPDHHHHHHHHHHHNRRRRHN